VAKLPITLHWKWIKGHQDDFVSFSKLSPLSQDNVWADRLAKACMKNVWCPLTTNAHRNGLATRDGHSVITATNFTKVDFNRLYAKMWSEKGITYWSRKYKISNQQARTMDWDICGRAIDALKLQEQQRIVKHATGHFGNHKKLHQWKLQDRA
jgi:hypothetical protein